MAMTTEEYEKYIEFIEQVLFELTTIDDYVEILESVGVLFNGQRFQGGCHNDLDELGTAKYSVSFNTETRVFYCFVCNEGYNLLTFLKKISIEQGEDKSINDCLKYVCNILEIPFSFKNSKPKKQKEYDWKKTIGRYAKGKGNHFDIDEDNLTIYDESIMDSLDEYYHESFIDDNISIKTMKKFGIKFHSYFQQIAIPVYDDDGNFIGIHARNLNPEIIEMGYKYMPFRSLNGFEYKFKTSLVLYGLNKNKENINKSRSMILLEAPKSVLQLDEILEGNNISVGMFGMGLKTSQRHLILKYEINTCYILMCRAPER